MGPEANLFYYEDNKAAISNKFICLTTSKGHVPNFVFILLQSLERATLLKNYKIIKGIGS
jgi:hypothetical protein